MRNLTLLLLLVTAICACKKKMQTAAAPSKGTVKTSEPDTMTCTFRGLYRKLVECNTNSAYSTDSATRTVFINFKDSSITFYPGGRDVRVTMNESKTYRVGTGYFVLTGYDINDKLLMCTYSYHSNSAGACATTDTFGGPRIR